MHKSPLLSNVLPALRRAGNRITSLENSIQMMNNEQKAHSLPSASLEQNGVLSAALSVEEDKLIALFMEITVTDFVWNEHLGLVHCDENGEFQIDEDLQYYSPRTNWNDLMPVVEKIENSGAKWTEIYGDSKSYECLIYLQEDEYNYPSIRISKGTKIEVTWLAVVEFIKWYNDNADNGQGLLLRWIQ